MLFSLVAPVMVAASVAQYPPDVVCVSDNNNNVSSTDCSLNGRCLNHLCVCDPPWYGIRTDWRCATFAAKPATPGGQYTPGSPSPTPPSSRAECKYKYTHVSRWRLRVAHCALLTAARNPATNRDAAANALHTTLHILTFHTPHSTHRQASTATPPT